MKLGILKVNYMKKINKSKLAILIGLSVLSINVFAANTMNTNSNTIGGAVAPVEKDISSDDLSKIRMKIQQTKLEQQLEQEKTNKLRAVSEQMKIQDSVDGSGSKGVVNNSPLPDDMRATEEQRLSDEQNINQNVGFIYKSDAVSDSLGKKSKGSNSIIDALTSDKDNSNEKTDELSKVLKKFDDLKKEADTTVKTVNEYVVKKTFLGADITMLSIFDGTKSAKIKFTYLIDDGIQKKKVGNVISVEEGKSFKVEDDNFNVQAIDKDGVVIVNTTTKEDMILTRNR